MGALSCQCTDALRLLTGVPLVPLPCATVYSTCQSAPARTGFFGRRRPIGQPPRRPVQPTAHGQGSGIGPLGKAVGPSHTLQWLGVAGRGERARPSVAQGATRWSQETGHVESTERDSQCKHAVGNPGPSFRPGSSVHGLTLAVRVHCQQIIAVHEHTVHWMVRSFQSPCHSASCIQSTSADTK